MQNHYCLVYCEEEREIMPTLKMFGVGMIPWSVLARGILARPPPELKSTSRGQSDMWLKSYLGAGNADIIDRVEEVAKEKGITITQVAVAWCLAKDGVTAPVVGTTQIQNLREIIDAIDIKLTEEDIKYLEEPYKPMAILGHS